MVLCNCTAVGNKYRRIQGLYAEVLRNSISHLISASTSSIAASDSEATDSRDLN